MHKSCLHPINLCIRCKWPSLIMFAFLSFLVKWPCFVLEIMGTRMLNITHLSHQSVRNYPEKGVQNNYRVCTSSISLVRLSSITNTSRTSVVLQIYLVRLSCYKYISYVCRVTNIYRTSVECYKYISYVCRVLQIYLVCLSGVTL